MLFITTIPAGSEADQEGRAPRGAAQEGRADEAQQLIMVNTVHAMLMIIVIIVLMMIVTIII